MPTSKLPLFRFLFITLPALPGFAQQAALADLPTFQSRRLLAHGEFRQGIARADSNPVQVLNLSPYSSIDPEKSLLVHDCGNWCNSEVFIFPTIFSRAARVAGLAGDKTSQLWFKSAASNKIPGFANGMHGLWDGTRIAKAPFQLLAVVNRIDLGSWNSHTRRWEGPELRFVFGFVQNDLPRDFTLIIEFVLPPTDAKSFRQIAQDWLTLSSASRQQFGSQLQAVAQKYLSLPISLARLRTNSRLVGTWSLTQWEFTAKGLEPMPLDDQIDDSCAFGVKICTGYIQMWKQFAKTVPTPTHWPVTIQEPESARYSVNLVPNSGSSPGEIFDEGMPTPLGLVNPNLVARGVFSLQQCSFCHGSETNNAFTHIKNRPAKDTKAALSPFLQGKDPSGANIKPDIADLKSGNEAVMAVANVTYKTMDASGALTVSRSQTRKFHDLGRRLLFMTAVLNMPPDVQVPDDAVLAAVQQFAPDFRH